MSTNTMSTSYNTPIVSRIFRYSRRNERSGVLRTVTVAYEYNRETYTLKYGASVFKNDEKNPVFTHIHRKQCNHTASERLNKVPVIHQNVTDDGTISEFYQKIQNFIGDRFIVRDSTHRHQ